MFPLRTARGLFLRVLALPLLLGSLQGCGEFPAPKDLSRVDIQKTDSVLLVVESGLYAGISGFVDEYRRDLRDEGCAVSVVLWGGGDASELRELIGSRVRSGSAGGTFLVGELPAAWYEQEGINGYEEFPCDLYFMDVDARWEDGDGDGMFDSHAPLMLDGFVSRVAGTGAEVSRYFEKVHRYRTGERYVWEGAYIFKDDDWSDFCRGSSFELRRIYGGVDMCEDIIQTHRSSYMSKLCGSGAEYVYQWIHSYPSFLCIRGTASYEYIHTSDIEKGNFKGVFYNLFDCSAARFTQDNLGYAYLMHTDYGLAVLGSTKVGGNYHPQLFHYALANGARWGDAYRCWYNEYGVADDRWFMGMVILGDPMLTLSADTRLKLNALAEDDIPPSPREIEALEDALRRFGY